MLIMSTDIVMKIINIERERLQIFRIMYNLLINIHDSKKIQFKKKSFKLSIITN